MQSAARGIRSAGRHGVGLAAGVIPFIFVECGGIVVHSVSGIINCLFTSSSISSCLVGFFVSHLSHNVIFIVYPGAPQKTVGYSDVIGKLVLVAIRRWDKREIVITVLIVVASLRIVRRCKCRRSRRGWALVIRFVVRCLCSDEPIEQASWSRHNVEKSRKDMSVQNPKKTAI
jgi:hypothetical protein